MSQLQSPPNLMLLPPHIKSEASPSPTINLFHMLNKCMSKFPYMAKYYFLHLNVLAYEPKINAHMNH